MPTDLFEANGISLGAEREPIDLFQQAGLNKGQISASSIEKATPFEMEHPYLSAAWETAKETMKESARPVIETSGMVGGGLVGSWLGPLGTAGGAGLGYGMGKDVANKVLGEDQPRPLKERLVQSAKDVGEGAMYEMGGQAAPVVAGGIAKGIGKVVKPLLGRMGGHGTAAVDEALQSAAKSDTSFNPLKTKSEYDKALRGKITGEEIVDNAKNALVSIKEQRGEAYRETLANISKNQQPINMKPIWSKLKNLMREYHVTVDPATGKVDTSRIAMGKTGRNDIQEIIDTVASWGGKQGDDTIIGLDTLKRQLDDFYSDSSQARQFVTSLRKKVYETAKDAVPEYAEMTKGYADATQLIKDIESGLMLRKQGMTGRIVADQTLRRLMSAMKDNFALRRDLLESLGSKSGENLLSQVAGYTMRSPIPLGISGSGPALVGEIALTAFNPKFWPVLAASSPRVQGEFLRLFGHFTKQAKRIPGSAIGATAIQMKDEEETGGD